MLEALARYTPTESTPPMAKEATVMPKLTPSAVSIMPR